MDLDLQGADEDVHPLNEAVLELGVQVLSVQVVEELQQAVQQAQLALVLII